MPSPRIFLSSTCYDLAVVRSELRAFITEFGYEPHMSEFSDVLFDPRQHTHTACLQEIHGCDMLILIVGKRFGGKAIPQAVSAVDFDSLVGQSTSEAILKVRDKLSITQLEVLKAIISKVPVFAFIDTGVLNDHQTYEKNKDKAILADIEFPNIDKQETAVYIFEFINFIRHRATGNAITAFTHLDDVRIHLRKQWSALFQRLLYEQRHHQEEAQRIDYISSQISDIKTAIFASLNSTQLKETAKGSIKFRSLVEFIATAYRPKGDASALLAESISWNEVLDRIGVSRIEEIDEGNIGPRGCIIVLKDGTFFKCRYGPTFLSELNARWDAFRGLEQLQKEAIISALMEQFEIRPGMPLRYYAEKYEPSPREKSDSASTISLSAA